MAVQNKQQQSEKAEEFFDSAKDSAVMRSQFASQLEKQLEDKYITYYSSSMEDKPFWQNKKFLGGLAFAAVLTIFVSTLAIYQPWAQPQSGQQDQTEQMATTIGAELAYFEGGVEYNSEGGWQPVSESLSLSEGDMIRTLDDGRAIINLDDGSAVRLNYNSELELTALNPNDMQLTNVAGEVYSRVASLDRDFEIVTETLTYQSLGTAYTTFNTKAKQGVKVFHSKVNVENKDTGEETLVEEGKQYFKTEGEVKELSIEEVKKDEFALWNKKQDEQNEAFKDELGKLKDLTAPELKITNPANNATVEKSKITLKGSTEADATIKVKGQQVDNKDGQFIAEVSLKEGKNEIKVVASDAAGNTTQKTWKVTYKKAVAQTETQPIQEESSNSNGAEAGSIQITSVTTDSKGLKVNWNVSNLGDGNGFKVVYGLNPNPAYGVDNAIYVGDKNARNATISLKDGKTYNVRVCRYLANGSCDTYSNNMQKTAPESQSQTEPEQSISSANLSVNSEKLTWTTDTGTTGKGFKITYGATGTPPDYNGGNALTFVDALSYNTTKNGFYKVCAWDGGSGCTAISNVVEVSVF